MVGDAEQHASEDKSRREEIDTRNRLDAMVYEVEKNVKEWAEQLDSTNRDRLNEALDGAKKALRAGETSEIKSALEELSQAYSAAGASLYEAAQAQQPSDSGGEGAEAETGAGEAKPEDVVEADYEIVDDSKS
jgi:molecular chaperone DnaK